MDFKPSRILADLGGFVLLAAIGLWGTDYGRHGQFIQPPGNAYLEAVDTTARVREVMCASLAR